MAEIRYKGQIYSGAAAFGSADDVSYDNTTSGLTATDVQDALDELKDEKYEKPSGGIPKTDLSGAVQTSLGKADTALQITDIAGCVFYKTIGTHFAELVKNDGDMAIIYAQRLSVDSCAIYAVHNYNGTIHTKQVYNSGLFTIATNAVGTVSILYNNAALNVYAVAIKY